MSAESAVSDLSDHAMGKFDEGKHAAATFLDLSKTFDTLDRSILTSKPRCFGLKWRAIEWFASYFSPRK